METDQLKAPYNKLVLLDLILALPLAGFWVLIVLWLFFGSRLFTEWFLQFTGLVSLILEITFFIVWPALIFFLSIFALRQIVARKQRGRILGLILFFISFAFIFISIGAILFEFR